MKFSVAILLSLVAVINGVAFDTSEKKIILTEKLFTQAFNYQNLLTTLQKDMNEAFDGIHTSMSKVLGDTSTQTLKQIQKNANQIIQLYSPTYAEIHKASLPDSDCIKNIIARLNETTDFTGYRSSNCMADFDKSLQTRLGLTFEFLQPFNGLRGDVQRTVVEAFIGLNVYTQSNELEKKFVDAYNNFSRDWSERQPNIEPFISSLNKDISGFSKTLESCFQNIQKEVAPVFGSFKSDVIACEKFDTTTDPFAVYNS